MTSRDEVSDSSQGSDTENIDRNLNVNRRRGRPEGLTKQYISVSDRLSRRGELLVNCNVNGCSHEYPFAENKRSDHIRRHLSRVHNIELSKAEHKRRDTATVISGVELISKISSVDVTVVPSIAVSTRNEIRGRGRPEGNTKSYIVVSDRFGKSGELLVNCSVPGCTHEYPFAENKRSDRIRQHLRVHNIELSKGTHKRRDAGKGKVVYEASNIALISIPDDVGTGASQLTTRINPTPDFGMDNRKRGRPLSITNQYVVMSDRLSKNGELLVNCNVPGCTHEYSFAGNKRSDRIRQHMSRVHGIELSKASRKRQALETDEVETSEANAVAILCEMDEGST